jgi:hypothetical protein
LPDKTAEAFRDGYARPDLPRQDEAPFSSPQKQHDRFRRENVHPSELQNMVGATMRDSAGRWCELLGKSRRDQQKASKSKRRPTPYIWRTSGNF